MGLKTPVWWYGDGGAMAALLKPVATVYGLFAARRGAGASPYVSRLPVICVGNFTAGGGGKTPTAIAIAEILKMAGERPAFLTRGYGGKAKGPVIVTEDSTAIEVGDEPLLLARHAPVVVSADRAKGAQVAETLEATVIVMDDGFQNPQLAKDLSLIVMDAKSGVGNGLTIPAGPLRAPLDEQLPSADALILVGDGKKGAKIAEAFAAAGKPVLKARMEASQDTRWLGILPVIGFAGIARPEKFFATLRESGARLVEKHSFPDHHRFTEKDAKALLDEAEAKKCMLVTTEKDWVRLPDDDEETKAGELRFRSRPLPVRLRVGDEAALGDLLMATIRSKRG